MRRLPVTLERVHTNLPARLTNIRMKYFCRKESLRRIVRVIRRQRELHLKRPAFERRVRGTVELGEDIRHVLLVHSHPDPLRGALHQIFQLTHDAIDGFGREILAHDVERARAWRNSRQLSTLSKVPPATGARCRRASAARRATGDARASASDG